MAGVGIAAAALRYFIGSGDKASDKASVSTNDTTQVGESFEQFRLHFFDDPQFQKERTQFPLIDIGYDIVRDTIYTKAENFNPVAIVGDHDGQGNGIELEISKQIVASVDIPVILGAGCGLAMHFPEAFAATGAKAVCAGTFFARRDQNLIQTRSQIVNAGVDIRV